MPRATPNRRTFAWQHLLLVSAAALLALAVHHYVQTVPAELTAGEPRAHTASPPLPPRFQADAFELRIDPTQGRPSPFVPYKSPSESIDHAAPPTSTRPAVAPPPAQPKVEPTSPLRPVAFGARDADPGVTFVGTVLAGGEALALVDHTASGRRLRVRRGDRLPDAA